MGRFDWTDEECRTFWRELTSATTQIIRGMAASPGGKMHAIFDSSKGKTVFQSHDLKEAEETAFMLRLRRVLERMGDTFKAQSLAAELGRKGGMARMEKLTPQQRSEIARNAAAARWQR